MQQEWKLTKLLGNGNEICGAEWQVTFTDPDDFPGIQSQSGGVNTFASPLDQDAATKQEIVNSIIAALGPNWQEIQSYSVHHLTHLLSVKDLTEVDRSDLVEQPSLPGYVAQKRWAKESGGITVSGVPVYTDDRSKMMIMGARVKAESDADFTTFWKTSDGSFVPLDATAIIAISDAVLAHVDACFQLEASVLAEIAAGSITITAEIDAAFA